MNQCQEVPQEWIDLMKEGFRKLQETPEVTKRKWEALIRDRKFGPELEYILSRAFWYNKYCFSWRKSDLFNPEKLTLSAKIKRFKKIDILNLRSFWFSGCAHDDPNLKNVISWKELGFYDMHCQLWIIKRQNDDSVGVYSLDNFNDHQHFASCLHDLENMGPEDILVAVYFHQFSPRKGRTWIHIHRMHFDIYKPELADEDKGLMKAELKPNRPGCSGDNHKIERRKQIQREMYFDQDINS